MSVQPVELSNKRQGGGEKDFLWIWKKGVYITLAPWFQQF